MPKVMVAARHSKAPSLCPMPGLVVSVNVQQGQDVKAGEPLAVVEAMKMENVLTAEQDVTIKKVNAKKGDSLALDDVIPRVQPKALRFAFSREFSRSAHPRRSTTRIAAPSVAIRKAHRDRLIRIEVF